MVCLRFHVVSLRVRKPAKGAKVASKADSQNLQSSVSNCSAYMLNIRQTNFKLVEFRILNWFGKDSRRISVNLGSDKSFELIWKDSNPNSLAKLLV